MYTNEEDIGGGGFTNACTSSSARLRPTLLLGESSHSHHNPSSSYSVSHSPSPTSSEMNMMRKELSGGSGPGSSGGGGGGGGLAPTNRKISVSFVSEIAPTCNTSLDPTQAFQYVPDPSLKRLQQKILRLQVMQVILGLTLMVLSGVALIEERGILGLGFGLISALLGITSAAFGIQQCDLKMTSILNLFALLGLLPTFYFAIDTLILYSKFYLGFQPFPINSQVHLHQNHHHHHHHHNLQHPHLNKSISSEHLQVHHDEISSYEYSLLEDPSSITTIWTLSWLELFHLIPLSASILYLLFLYRHLSYYTHY